MGDFLLLISDKTLYNLQWKGGSCMRRLVPFTLASLLLLTGCSSIHQHKYNPANFQEPATCSVCGKTQGFTLEPEFEKRDLDTPMTLNTEYQYNTICSKDETITTVGKVSVISDTIITEDETHPAKDGYEYRTVVSQLTFSDFNSNEYGFKYNFFTTDFYDITSFTESYGYNTDKQVNEFKVNWHGVESTCSLNTVITKTDWKKNAEGTYTKIVTLTQTFMIPVGYDGIIIGYRNSGIDVTDTQFFWQYYNADEFLLYRLGGTTNE